MRSLIITVATVAALSVLTQCQQERELVLKPSEPMPAVQIP
jgi:hypothetical protein